MPDATTTTTIVNDNIAALAPLAADIQTDIALGQKVIAAYKQGGKSAAMAILPDVIVAAKQAEEDIVAAMPTIKAGWKTTEFLLTAGTVAGIAILSVIQHKQLTTTDYSIAGSVVAVYTVVRGILKK
jgi:hypothetical protein